MGLIPLPLVDHLLNLGQIGLGGQHDLIVADPRLVEHHGVQPVQQVARTGISHHGAESAEHEQGRGHRPDRRQAATAPPAVHHSGPQRVLGFVLGHQRTGRWPPEIVAPIAQQRGQGIALGIAEGDFATGCQRIEQQIGVSHAVQPRALAPGLAEI
ncbi:hypothetical protein A5636_17170 [Mycobacterium asiaticum]|uniref:Uncharacterized protein n=1 Tax=Mycobacterium asiaticum TaxID=1790 RepID=A0A1A3NFT3_MYCAS|nr:hypothetical protein A5636_17170 [Mycobacterium asiaticum]